MCQTAGTDISCCLIDICFRVCHCNIERLQWPIIISINYWHFLKKNYDLHSISTISVLRNFTYFNSYVNHPIFYLFFGFNFILQSNAWYFQFEYNTLKCIFWCKDKTCKMGHTVSEIGCMLPDMVQTPNIDLLNERD